MGEVYPHLEYFPFGETWANEVTNNLRVPYRFTGKELDEETQLYYFGARYYDPRTSVWQSADPILGSYLDGKPSGGVFEPRNLASFCYAHNNPIKLTDPDGKAAAVVVVAVVGVVVIAGLVYTQQQINKNTYSDPYIFPGRSPFPLIRPYPFEHPDEYTKAKPRSDTIARTDTATRSRGSKTVFRGLTARNIADLQTKGAILPADPKGKITPDQHVAGVPSVRHLSPFVSATKDPKVAEAYHPSKFRLR